MILQLKYVFSILLVALFISSCEKEVSFENGGIPGIITPTGTSSGTSVFTFDGGTNNCNGSTVFGTYIAGTALNAEDSVIINVNVGTVGTYNIGTALINGVSFSGTGTFVSTGLQPITLTGSGTPTVVGNYSYIPGINGCNFLIPVLAAGGGGGNTTDTNFFRCAVDGVNKTFNTGLTATNVGLGIFIDGDENNSAASPALTLGLTNGLNPVNAGAYSLASITNFTKICIPTYDPDGSAANIWTFASAGQSGGFTVNITSISATRISGTFNGTVYDNNGAGSASKVFTNGEFSVGF